MMQALFAPLFLAVILLVAPSARAVDDTKTIYDFDLITLDGQEIDMSRFKGQVLLIVNTASRCGFTPQYKDLEELYELYKDRGLVVLGFPSNDFAGQEPGSNTEIKAFCANNFGVTFPMMCKQHVTGQEKQPIFQYLTENAPEEFQGEVVWNFEKFLVDRKGRVRARYGSVTNPKSQQLEEKLEELLSE